MTNCIITVDTALALLDDPMPHEGEYRAPGLNGFGGSLIIDGHWFEVVDNDKAPYRKRLRAKLFPWRWWR